MTLIGMNFQRVTITLLVLAVLVLLGVYGFMNSDIVNNTVVSTSAAESQETTIYIPLLQNSYPLSSIFGVQVDPEQPEKGFNQILNAGANWIRHLGVIWSDIEATKGARNWSVMADLEAEFINASQEGKKVILIITSTPTWAQKISGAYCGPIKEGELASFGQFVYDVVSRYSKPPYNVKFWEVWNEPDAPPVPDFYTKPWGCWGDQTDNYYGGGYFAEMLKVAYPNIKAADPTAQVLIGGLLLDCDPRPNSNWCAHWNHDQRPPKFLEGILLNNGANFFDGIAFHGYDYFDYTNPQLGEYYNPNWGNSWSDILWDGSSTNRTGPVSKFKAEYIRELLAQYNVVGKYLLNTESALVCGATADPPGGPGCETNDNSLYEQTKASYVSQAYAAGMRDRLIANIWYHIFGWRNSGLLNEDLSARPAYEAYDVANEQFGGATFIQNVNTYPGVQIYEFERNNKTIWLIWSLDGSTQTVTLPSTPDEVKDFRGVVKTPSNTFTATIYPHYLIWYP